MRCLSGNVVVKYWKRQLLSGSNRKKFRAKFRALGNKAEGTHALLFQSPSAPFFSLNFFEVTLEAVVTSLQHKWSQT